MKGWKYTRRKLAGYKGKVRVKVRRKSNGNYQVRRVGKKFRNSHD